MSGPPNKGLWRLMAGDWIRLERVDCARFDGANPCTVHAAAEGEPHALCGRPVIARHGLSDTDTPSMIECKPCAKVVEVTL